MWTRAGRLPVRRCRVSWRVALHATAKVKIVSVTSLILSFFTVVLYKILTWVVRLAESRSDNFDLVRR
jgi:hypothetical protein